MQAELYLCRAERQCFRPGWQIERDAADRRVVCPRGANKRIKCELNINPVTKRRDAGKNVERKNGKAVVA
jgi:hypothetical protein